MCLIVIVFLFALYHMSAQTENAWFLIYSFVSICLNMGLKIDRVTIRINFQRTKNCSNLTAKWLL